MRVHDFGSMLSLELARQVHEERMRIVDALRASMFNLSICLRDAGALAHAWNRGAMNGAAWAMGMEVLQRFGPPTPESK